jgi:hypothetical protein
MIVSDMRGEHSVASLQELERILVNASAEEQADDIWMSHDHENYPTLAILVKGGLACVHYFPAEGDPRFLSVGNVSALECSPTVAFPTVSGVFPPPCRPLADLQHATHLHRWVRIYG